MSDGDDGDAPADPDASVDDVTDTPLDQGGPDAGLCTTSRDCDDGIACTQDTCLPYGCHHGTLDSLCGYRQHCDPMLGCTGGSRCTGGQMACDLGCADVQTDPANCGYCNHSCGDGGSCAAGRCFCGAGNTNCGYLGCVDLQTSTHNCGACGNACGRGATCVAGVCRCGGGMTACYGACVDTATDGNNCGACDIFCGAASCIGGVCQCPGTTSICHGACVDFMTDQYSCGGCGIACSSGAVCSSGHCACPGTRGMLCAAGCTDLATDAHNCGACGMACTGGMTCTDGHCGCPATRATLCGTTCTDLASDANHCGACGTVCPAGCSAGHCTAVAGVASGYGYTCARMADGTVQCWGANDTGQLATAATTTCHDPTGRSAPCRASPMAVPGLTTVVDLSAGGFHVCARLADGTVQCWGDNGSGQLGYPTVTTCGLGRAACSPTPTTVPGLTGVAHLALGLRYSCALMSDGTVQCWGENQNGEAGLPTTTASCPDSGGGTFPCISAPTTVPGLAHVTALASGSFHTCALLMDGTVRCWGSGESGQLGFVATSTCATYSGSEPCATTPTAVPGLDHVVAIAAGPYATCAVRADGTVRCWGQNQYGALGYATLAMCSDLASRPVPCSPVPTVVPGLSNVVALALGATHSCALRADHGVQCWGQSDGGRLGTGTTPLCADMESGTGHCSLDPLTVPGLTGVADLVAGNGNTCAHGTDGSLRCWGVNTDGQDGDGTMVDRLVPTPVAF